MKLQKTALLGVLLLALCAGLAGAAPAPESIENSEVTQAQPAVVEAEAPACDEPLFSTVTFKADYAASQFYTCGSCSYNPCKGAAVNSVCGFSGGQWTRCQDYLGLTCSTDGGARCRCSNDPLP